jgi:hypothetical protein
MDIDALEAYIALHPDLHPDLAPAGSLDLEYYPTTAYRRLRTNYSLALEYGELVGASISSSLICCPLFD